MAMITAQELEALLSTDILQAPRVASIHAAACVRVKSYAQTHQPKSKTKR